MCVTTEREKYGKLLTTDKLDRIYRCSLYNPFEIVIG